MKINERISKDSEFLMTLKLSELRLLKDGDVDWFVLIPLIENMIEWSDLSEEQQVELTKEISLLTKLLKEMGYDKVNIGSLGNIVPQLHIHVIGRKKTDRAWPGPIWGTECSNEFEHTKVDFWTSRISKAL
ncbi:HIT family protein [Halobacteriovorax sp.]|uniref:HIT family protein n=1 Tax=Halobacteriovorax sp. TaxID=2020862 RepID=UPI00356928D8